VKPTVNRKSQGAGRLNHNSPGLKSFQTCFTLAPHESSQQYQAHFEREEQPMKTPLDSIVGTLISGLILTVILYFFVVNFLVKTTV
jgi:hypothetical protein